MFKTTSTVTEPAPAEVPDPSRLIPLSVLQLDLPAPSGGWDAFLAGRGVVIVSDDIGRKSVSRGDARMLLDEQHENEVRRAEMRAAAERAAVESDQQWRAQIWTGAPAVEGVPAATLMLQANKDARPKRLTPLQEALAGEGMTYHALSSTPDEEA